jgi:hypothetical protein
MASGTDKIRVLIVDDIPETRENVRKLLALRSMSRWWVWRRQAVKRFNWHATYSLASS